MKVLFVIDRIELKYFEFNDLVTNFWIIKSLIERGCDVRIATIDMLKLKSSIAYTSSYSVYIEKEDLFYDRSSFSEALINDFDLVMFRPDPPVDLDYINATYIFDFVDKSKTVVLNDTCAVRNFNEKLHSVNFNDLMPENIVTASKLDILEFLDVHGEIILKPLNQCFGGGVMYLKKGDKNTSVIIDSMTNKGSKIIMVQKYISGAENGDMRVLILGDKVLPYSVTKTPSKNDFKFCEHNDSHVVKSNMSNLDLGKYEKVAEYLNKQGIYMAGLDVIDGQIIEVNVTSPCYFIREINNNFGCHLEQEIVDFIISFVDSKKAILV